VAEIAGEETEVEAPVAEEAVAEETAAVKEEE